MEQGESSSSEHYERLHFSPYSEHQYCTAIRSIDTVRALHQTVVSLRTALEESRLEIEKLKKQILINNEIQDARQCQHSNNKQEIVDYKKLGEKVAELEKIYYKTHPKLATSASSDGIIYSPSEGILKKEDKINRKERNCSDVKKTVSLQSPDITVSTQNINDSSVTGSTSSINNNQMASRIDVKIKVSSNINVNDNNDTESTSESSDVPLESQNDNKKEKDGDKNEDEKKENVIEQSSVTRRENPKVEVEMYEDSNTNTFNVDGKNLKIKVTSEENINVRKSVERISVQQSSTEYLNLDIDDLSEGDNSVFTEGATTPIEQRLQQVEDIVSDNEDEVCGAGLDEELPRKEREEIEDDIPEEVDDIELIFSSDDNKEAINNIQEDLVSLSEYEPWQEEGGDGTPILTKFSTLNSDDICREEYYEKKKALKAAKLKARESAKDKSLESTDSLSFDNNNQSADYKLSSLEKDSSLEQSMPISRDNSIDTFNRPTTFGKKWTNVNVLIETDISKVGIGDENIMVRRNTCPNPPIYRPHVVLQNRSSFRTPLAAKYPRSISRIHQPLSATKSLKGTETSKSTTKNGDLKCNSFAQTDISALSHQWRSETHLIGTDYGVESYTLPSKYNSPHTNSKNKNSLRLSEKTQEARRILLSDINFTSMVPELSRSADHLCQQKINEEEADDDDNYFKGNLLKTPDYTRITPSTSTAGVSQWTVNESTTQTEGGFWQNRGDSFDSSKSYSLKSGGGHNSTSMLNKHHRSRSVPSIRCVICKQNHGTIRPSESMHYTKTVTFREPTQKIRGSLPDLRHDCYCPRRIKSALYRMHESSGSTESLLEEADEFLRHSTDDPLEMNIKCHRRCSEADIHRDFHPSRQSLPFLPKTPNCLKIGQIAKVIARGGRIVVGKIRYVGPIANGVEENEIYVGLQLPHALGECDGSLNGKKFFECESNHGIFVPYKKIVMAWN
ncbi:hypothetical protein PVAND_009112 [Polypedilum vanderplanki]|uniref:CAP-Gly domain-containing protein n=1 Tax=Polypedilum vanderplanki TaxID=319348 RepID=A0A9J6CCH3_POLVA|nr:hypothetical protein PVAND_009112 [Polypedilum vanderplanki]